MEHKPLFQEAIAEHWEEWKKYGSAEALSLEESQQAREGGRQQPISAAQVRALGQERHHPHGGQPRA
eukprot:2334487-Pyramimonas_sp.AAC.1